MDLHETFEDDVAFNEEEFIEEDEDCIIVDVIKPSLKLPITTTVPSSSSSSSSSIEEEATKTTTTTTTTTTTKEQVVIQKLVSPKNVLENLLVCSICLDIFKDPVCSPCGHTYCKSCCEGLVNIRGGNSSSKCPLCRNLFFLCQLRPNFVVKEIVDVYNKSY